jgi:hypothetical protein
MASLSPRVSRFWEDPRMSSYFPESEDASDELDEDDIEQQRLVQGEAEEEDDRTPLDKTIDRIGMGAFFLFFLVLSFSRGKGVVAHRVGGIGSYQWTLVSLCGFGEHALERLL